VKLTTVQTLKMSWRGRLSSNFKEIRFVFNPQSQDSRGVFSFIHSNYQELKALNPLLPFVVRTSVADITPMVYARQASGPVEFEFSVANWDPSKIEKRFAELVKGAESPQQRDLLTFHDEDDRIAIKTFNNLKASGFFDAAKASQDFDDWIEKSELTKERRKLKLLFIEHFRERFQTLIDNEWKTLKREYNAELDSVSHKGEAEGLNNNQIADRVEDISTPLLSGDFKDHILNTATVQFRKQILDVPEIKAQIDKLNSLGQNLVAQAKTEPVYRKLRQHIEEAARIAKERNRGDYSAIKPPTDAEISERLNPSRDAIIDKLIRDEYERPDVVQDWKNIIDVNNPPQPGFWKIRI